MTTATTRFLLLAFACLCCFTSYSQAPSPYAEAARSNNFTTFTPRITTSKEAWKKLNRAEDYSHPEFGELPQNAPCTSCVEILEKRTSDQRQFRDIKDPKEIYTQQAYGEINYRKDGKWLSVDDRFTKKSNGVYQSDYYKQPVGVDANAHKTYMVTPQGKVYFNQWNLYAKTANGEILLAKADWSNYTAGDDGLYIKNIFNGIDAELHVYRGTIKTSFIMKKNAFGTFEQLIFRDEYSTTGRTGIAFEDNAASKNGIGKLRVYSGNEEVLRVNEAVIYPKDNPKNNIMTAAYSITDKYMDILVPFNWINDNIAQHELVIDPTVTGTATMAPGAIAGSKYNASCSFDSSCNYSMNVNVPAGTTVTGVSFTFTYNASAPCFGSDGGVRFSSGNCNTQVFTNASMTPGPTPMINVPIITDMQACVPAPSCAAQTMPFVMKFYRSCKGLTGCDNTCISASSPWIMTIRAKTVEFNDPVEPISYTSNNICLGDSIYVNTWASYGVAPYTYHWSFSPTGTPSLGTGSSTSITFPNIVNNTIFALITDACGNTTIDSLPITVNYAAAVATPSADTICSGETTGISLSSPSAGTTFTWTVVQNGVTGATAGSGTSIAQVLSTTTGAQGTALYTITPQNVGCMGLPITVLVTVNPPVIVQKNITICANELPFTWNGQTVNAGGTSVAVVAGTSAITGCDSTTILNLTVNPLLTATVNRTVCAGQMPYTWNGISVTAGGPAAATYTSPSTAYNCDSITTLNLTVVTTLTATQTVTICENQLPYTWYGVNVTQGGPTAATINTTSPTTGCDSITTLNLIVKIIPRDTVHVTICANQLPYSWNGFNVTTGGTAAAVYTSTSYVNGCDSITTLSLTVNPLLTAVQNITKCANELPLYWNGQTITAGGNAVATHTMASFVTGCDSTTTLNLIVNPLLTAVKTATVCSNQLPYVWNGINVMAGGNAAATFVTPSMVTGCDSTTTLNLIVNPVLTATQHITICTSQLPYSWNGITVTAASTTAAVFTTTSTANGCDSITTLNLTVNPVLTGIANKNICASQLPYVWNGITVAAGGNNVATYTTSSVVSGCDSTTTLNLVVNPAVTAVANKVICANQLPYTWNGVIVSAAGNAVATYNTTSTVTGCDSIVTLNLTVNPLINTTKTLTICNSQLPYTWNGQVLTAGGNAVATYTTASAVTGCDSTTTLNLLVNPVINVVKNITICSSQLPYSWNGQTITAGGNGVATYTTASSASNCDSTTTLNLTVNPVLTATKNITICASQLPYSWNGQTITAGGNAVGTYTTASAATGCDSITTLNLVVNPLLTATQTITKCANQMPFVWNGITVTTGGTTAATFTAASAVTGCDSTTTLNLTVKPVLTATKTITVCASQLPYSWNGINVTAGGAAAATYTMTSPTTNCDSITTLNLVVNPLITAVANKVRCANQMPYVWNGQTVTAGGTAVATYTTASLVTGCDSTTTLNLTVSPVINVTKNISVCTAQMPYVWNGITVNAGGNNVATFTTSAVNGGCDSTTVLNLTVNPVITAVKNLTKCINQIPFVWNGQTISAGGNAVATYTTASLVTGCDSTTTLNLTVNPVLTATKNLTICSGQLPYTWNGITLGAGGTAIATYTTTSTVTNCDSSTILNLNVVPALTATQTITICASQLPYTWNGLTVTAGGSAAATFSTFTPTSNCDSITTLELVVKPVHHVVIDSNVCHAQVPVIWNGQSYSATGNYTQNYTSSLNCDSTITLNLYVSAAPVNLQPKEVADCGSVVYKGNTYYTNVTVKDTVYNAWGCDSTYQNVYIKVLHDYVDTVKAEICAYQNYEWMGDSYNQSGMYRKQFTSARGCDSTVNLDLTVWNVSQVSISHNLDDVPCMDDSITVTGYGGVSYIWKLNGAEVGTGDQGIIPLNTRQNQIVLLGKDEHNCESNANIMIETIACCDLMIPNAFSPNGDGLNDKFGPETIGNPKEFKMMIFNRFGQLLFTSLNVGNKWDGTYLGKPCELGTYFFKVVTKCTNDVETNYKGDITLIR